MSGINLLLVDALNLIRRVYAAQSGEDDPEKVAGALSGSVQSLQRALRECRPTHVACVFDSEEHGWRHELYADYKAGRAPMPEALRLRLGDFKEAFLKLGVPSLMFSRYEADDIIATLAVKVSLRNGNVVILSTDKIFSQLLSDHIKIRDHFQRRDLDRSYIIEKYHVHPEQIVDFFALTGDSTNNIPGVPTVGPKTASKLLNEFKNLDQVLLEAANIKGSLGKTLSMQVGSAGMSQKLMRLKCDIVLGMNMRSLRYIPD